MSDDDGRYQRVNLRLPRDLHAALMQSAAQRSHSMNAEVVQRLEASFTEQKGGERDEALGMLLRLLARMVEVMAVSDPSLTGLRDEVRETMKRHGFPSVPPLR